MRTILRNIFLATIVVAMAWGWISYVENLSFQASVDDAIIGVQSTAHGVGVAAQAIPNAIIGQIKAFQARSTAAMNHLEKVVSGAEREARRGDRQVTSTPTITPAPIDTPTETPTDTPTSTPTPTPSPTVTPTPAPTNVTLQGFDPCCGNRFFISFLAETGEFFITEEFPDEGVWRTISLGSNWRGPGPTGLTIYWGTPAGAPVVIGFTALEEEGKYSIVHIEFPGGGELRVFTGFLFGRQGKCPNRPPEPTVPKLHLRQSALLEQ